jgi:hypothetical protein
MTAPHDDEGPPLTEVPPPGDYPDPIPFTRTRGAQNPGDVQDALDAAEQYVLGGMMLDKQAIDDVTAVLYDPNDFGQARHETIFRVILTLAGASAPVTAVTVADQLAEQGDLTRVGGVTYMHDLIASVASPASSGYYAGIVRDRATKRRLLAAGTRITQIAGLAETGEVDAVIAAATAELQVVLDRAADNRDASSSWSPVQIAGMDLTHMTEPTLLQRGDGVPILYAGSIHTFAGESEGGKTWLALEAIRQELLAGNAAAMLDFEDRPQRIVRRLIELGVPREVVEDLFRYVRPDGALTLATTPHLLKAVQGTTLCVIDGVTEAMTMHGMSLEDNEDSARFLSLLPRRIANEGPAVVQIDHVVKDEEKRGRYALGAGHKLAGIDGAQYKIITVAPFGKGKRGVSNVIVDKDREGSVRERTIGIKVGELILDSSADPRRPDERGPLRLTFDAPNPGERTQDGRFRPTHIMEEISKYLWVAPDLSQNDIVKNLPFKADHVRKALRQLIDEGYVGVRPGPRNAQLHHVIEPFSEKGPEHAGL